MKNLNIYLEGLFDADDAFDKQVSIYDAEAGLEECNLKILSRIDDLWYCQHTSGWSSNSNYVLDNANIKKFPKSVEALGLRGSILISGDLKNSNLRKIAAESVIIRNTKVNGIRIFNQAFNIEGYPNPGGLYLVCKKSEISNCEIISPLRVIWNPKETTFKNCKIDVSMTTFDIYEPRGREFIMNHICDVCGMVYDPTKKYSEYSLPKNAAKMILESYGFAPRCYGDVYFNFVSDDMPGTIQIADGGSFKSMGYFADPNQRSLKMTKTELNRNLKVLK